MPAATSLHVAGQVWLLTIDGHNVAVQVGSEGVLVVNPGPKALADAVLAEIRKISGGKRIRLIVVTNDDPAHVGASLAVGAGPTPAAQRAAIVAHENSALRIATRGIDGAALPSDVFYRGTREIYFNGEPIEVIHVPSATSDGDVIVFFRKSDVVAVGDGENERLVPHHEGRARERRGTAVLEQRDRAGILVRDDEVGIAHVPRGNLLRGEGTLLQANQLDPEYAILKFLHRVMCGLNGKARLTNPARTDQC